MQDGLLHEQVAIMPKIGFARQQPTARFGEMRLRLMSLGEMEWVNKTLR